MSPTKQTSVQAWEAFCDQLKLAGAVLARESTPDDELTQAEGLRKLVRTIRMGFEASLEYGNTDFPEVYQVLTPTTLGEGETADAHYHQAMIDSARLTVSMASAAKRPTWSSPSMPARSAWTAAAPRSQR